MALLCMMVADASSSPGDKPILYVSSIGSDGNDGLTLTTAKATLSGAIDSAACTAGCSILVQAGTFTIAKSIPVKAANVSIRCANEGGSPLTKIKSAVNAQLIVNARNFTVNGCYFEGPGAGISTKQAIVVNGSTANFLTFHHNTVTRYGSTGGSGILEVTASHVRITNNRLFDNNDVDVFVNNVTPNAQISDIVIANNIAGEVVVHASARNSAIDRVIIRGNLLHAGQNSKKQFCEEVGDFSPTQLQEHVTNIISMGNRCYLTANATNGGFSFSVVSNLTVNGDLFDARGKSFSIASFEVVRASNAAIIRTTSLNGFGGNGIACDRCRNASFVGNTIHGFRPNVTGNGIHVNVSSTTDHTASDNLISNNVVVFPPAGSGIGIWLQCNASGASCNANHVSHNLIFGADKNGSQGIKTERDDGTMDSTQILGNLITHVTTGINNTGATNTAIRLGEVTAVAIPLNNISGGTLAPPSRPDWPK